MSRTRLRARADRVNQECNLGEMLQSYGYAVVPDREREQQFSCDLHGMDNKPSARLYGYNNTTYCWVCQKKRDAIAYVMEKENVNFRQAIEQLEQRLGLPSLPWTDEDEERPADPRDALDEIANPGASFEDERDRLRKFLSTLTSERDLDAKTLLSFWEVFDRVDYGMARQDWPESKGVAAMAQLRGRLMERLREAS
jgi:hypothetical protein